MESIIFPARQSKVWLTLAEVAIVMPAHDVYLQFGGLRICEVRHERSNQRLRVRVRAGAGRSTGGEE